MRDLCSSTARALQDSIASSLEALDGGRFREEIWQRPGGGGGRSLSLAHDSPDEGLFEKGGVNFSEVEGELSEEFAAQLPGEGRSFYATGVSLVLHPTNPRVPTVHANFRYIEKGSKWWVGGGADLTPYRLYEDDARHFHQTWKGACDRHDLEYYPRFKRRCDEYFFLSHRGEARGIGGIFFDNLCGDPDTLFAFWKDVGGSFLDAYVPICERRRDEVPTPRERAFQLRRRGRYVEFNLLYDRGTAFGLKTGGRIESILMSLPPLVRWDIDSGEPLDAEEKALLAVLREPRQWVQ